MLDSKDIRPSASQYESMSACMYRVIERKAVCIRRWRKPVNVIRRSCGVQSLIPFRSSNAKHEIFFIVGVITADRHFFGAGAHDGRSIAMIAKSLIATVVEVNAPGGIWGHRFGNRQRCLDRSPCDGCIIDHCEVNVRVCVFEFASPSLT